VSDRRLWAFGRFRMEPAEGRLFRDGNPVMLTPKAFEALVYLLERSGRLVTRAELIAHLWPDTIVDEGNLTSTIWMIRRALGGDDTWIETVPKRGYRFRGVVREERLDSAPDCDIGDATTANQSIEAMQVLQSGELARAVSTKWRVSALFAAGAVAVTLLGVARAISLRDAASSMSSGVRTVAILPFRSLPATAGTELLDVGLTDVLITRLGQLPNLRVVPLSSSERVRDLDPVDAGHRLGANDVLAGTLQYDRSSVRASVRLVSVQDGTVLWSGTFDAGNGAIFAVQDAIVVHVIDELGPQLSSGERTRIARSATSNREAFDAYLKGRAYFVRGKQSDFDSAIQAFRQAIALDPQYADAWAAMSLAYRALPLTNDARPRDAFPEAKRAATRALEINPDQADAHAALGMIAFWWDRNWREAERYLRHAIELQPNSGVAHLYLGHVLSNLDRGSEAVAEAQRARELDPGWRTALALEGQFLFFARRYREALARVDAALELEPTMWQAHIMRAYPLIELARFDEAMDECDKAYELSGGQLYALALRGYGLARLGRNSDGEAILRRLEELSRARYVPPHHLALVAYALGHLSTALSFLGKALTERDVYVVFLGTDPKWDSLRANPAFQEVLARAQLSDVSQRVAARLASAPQVIEPGR